MTTINKPKINVNGIQDKNSKEVGSVALEIATALGLIIVFLLKLVYYYCDAFYTTFINPPEPKSVKGEIVLITGTGHGIGKEIALLYASKGATVVGWDINIKNNENTIKEIQKLGYPKAYAYVCDVTNRQNVLDLAKQVEREVGEVSILINNAGIMPTHPLLEHTTKEIEAIMNINVMAHFWTLEAFLPSMKKNNKGHIVTLSSMAGQMGLVNLVPYCASKFAVRGLSEALHEELRSLNPNNKIQVTCIYPYMVDTGLCKNPKIRFPKLMPLESPKTVAETIYYCQTNNITERTIPRYLVHLNNIGRCIPMKAMLDLKDTFEAFIDTDKQ